jgi:hypothetical protein
MADAPHIFAKILTTVFEVSRAALVSGAVHPIFVPNSPFPEPDETIRHT